MRQIVEESTSLERIRGQYHTDAANFPDCLEFWDELVSDKEEHISDLTDLLKKYLCEEEK